jgi:hypothetical protein
MHTPCTAATVGLLLASSAAMSVSRFGSAVDLDEPNSLMSAPPENAFTDPVMTIAFTF